VVGDVREVFEALNRAPFSRVKGLGYFLWNRHPFTLGQFCCPA
jgi:hypothetical protein